MDAGAILELMQVGLLTAIFYRMGAFTEALKNLKDKVSKLERRSYDDGKMV